MYISKCACVSTCLYMYVTPKQSPNILNVYNKDVVER